MDRPLTEVQKFIKETQRQIDEEGLRAMSGTNFSHGDPIRWVLKAKQYEYRINSGGVMGMLEPKNHKGKFASVALIAKNLNDMNQAFKNGETTPLVFEDEIEMDVPRYDISDVLSVDNPFKFNDSRKKGERCYEPTDR